MIPRDANPRDRDLTAWVGGGMAAGCPWQSACLQGNLIYKTGPASVLYTERLRKSNAEELESAEPEDSLPFLPVSHAATAPCPW